MLEEVDSYRRAARAILRASVPQDDRANALLRLMEFAKASEDPAFAAGAIVGEIEWSMDRPFLQHDRRALDLGDPIIRRHRSMRAEGLSSCPRCLSPLTTRVEWASWSAEQDALIRELDAREGAIA